MHYRDVYLADFLKTNLSKIAVICVKWRQKAGFWGLISCKIKILTKEKERATRKKEGEEEKAMVALLVFVMAAVVFAG